VPPIAAPSASRLAPVSATPQVDSYDEETYRLKPGDSFRTISQAKYYTEKYERALMLWNRNHPRASDGARQDPPVLQPGQDVYIPPIRMLEKYYPEEGAEPPSAAPPAPPPPPAPTGSVGLDTPRMPNGAPIVAAAPSAPARPAAGVEKSYRVRGSGEMLLTIARQTLGNGDRWVEIYQLNPRYDPKQPIPGGSVLRLPKDARVETGEAP
jgi:hypothetical protein